MSRTALAVALLILAGCGSAQHVGPLEWKSRPRAFTPPTLPQDRVVLGTVRNSSSDDDFTIDASDLRVRDAAGRELRGHAQFIGGYAHGLYGAYQKPARIEESELLRLGLRLDLGPGRDAPLYVAYRLRPGLKRPLHLHYGRWRLALPG